jgi:hypothetical protein
MLSHHRGLRITGEQRLRFATTISQAADDADCPPILSSARGADRLPGMGNSPGHGQLPAGCPAHGPRPCPTLGLGRCAALPALSAK